MDVSIRLSLQGGHQWEFVCDEDDPMVFGLVSALPGAKLDDSLPSDGLIQVESRSGQRFFLSRSSLVALTITRLPARQKGLITDAAIELRASSLLAPMPFVMRQDVFDASTTELILQAAARATKADGHGLQEVDIDALPTAAVEALVAVINEAKTCLGQEVCEESHINVAVRRLSPQPSAHVPLPAAPRRLLDFIIFLTASPRLGKVDLNLPDRWISRSNDVATSGRTISILPNTALVFSSVNSLKTLDLQVAKELGATVIVSGSLCEGVSVERH